MAKIGNETKLILKLAEEHFEKRYTQHADCEHPDTLPEKAQGYRDGYRRAVNDYKLLISDILYELEGK